MILEQFYTTLTQPCATTLLRHKQALERVFARIAKDYADEEGTVLVVGHGASNDFILYALCGEEAHPTGRYGSDEVEPLPPPPHCCLTALVKNSRGAWEVRVAANAVVQYLY